MRRCAAVVAFVFVGCSSGSVAEAPTPDDLVLAADDLGDGWVLAGQALDAPVRNAFPNCDPATDGLVDLPSRAISSEYENEGLGVGLLQLIAEFESADEADALVAVWRRQATPCPIDASATGFSIQRDRWTPSLADAVGVHITLLGDAGEVIAWQWVAVTNLGSIVVVVNSSSEVTSGNGAANLAAELTMNKAGG